MDKLKLLLILLALGMAVGTSAQIVKGKLVDEGGNLVNAHGAGIMHYNGRYYLFGEIKTVFRPVVFPVIRRKICDIGSMKGSR